MKGLRRTIVLFLAGILYLHSQITVLAAPENIGVQIESFVEEHRDTTAGMAVSVFDKSGSVYKDYFGYADMEKELAVEEETVFEWGSATKLLVWVSVMQLWEQGKIDLDADVREYLPKDFLTNLNYDTPVTMTNLMNHNAGFQEMVVEIFVPEGTKVISLEAALEAHKPEQVYEPGTVTAYSNWGVALAGYIVERISGMEFAEYVHVNIFEPLGMEHSAIMPDLSDNSWVQEKRKQLQCYTVDGTLLPDCFYQISLYPAGMCTSTLEDFETFGRELLNENTFLFQSKETLKELFTPTDYYEDTGIPANCHGFWMVPYGKQVFGHGGNTAGCSSYLLIELESGTGVVVMTNQSNETVYNGEMMELLFGKFTEADYFGKKRELPEGIFRVARTTLKGPLKVLSLSYTLGEEKEDQFWVYENSDTAQRIRYPYTDFIPVSLGQFLLEMGLFLGWIIILIFTVISMLTSLVIKLVKKIRHVPKEKNPLAGWRLLAGVLQLFTLVLILLAVIMISGYALSSTYVWVFALLGSLGLIMSGMAVYGMIKNRKIKSSIKRKLYHGVIILGLLITICNIFYWDLYAFWTI